MFGDQAAGPKDNAFNGPGALAVSDGLKDGAALQQGGELLVMRTGSSRPNLLSKAAQVLIDIECRRHLTQNQPGQVSINLVSGAVDISAQAIRLAIGREGAPRTSSRVELILQVADSLANLLNLFTQGKVAVFLRTDTAERDRSGGTERDKVVLDATNRRAHTAQQVFRIIEVEDWLRYGLNLFQGLNVYGQSLPSWINAHRGEGAGRQGTQLHGKRLCELAFHRPFQGTSSQQGVVARVYNPFQRPLLDRQNALTLHQAFPGKDILDQEPGDAPDVIALESLERKDPVQAVEELRAKEVLRRLHELEFAGRIVEPEAETAFGLAHPQVRRQDDQGIGEVGGASEGIRQAAFAEHLKQHVEDLGMSFLNLVEQHHGEWLPPDRAGEQAFGLPKRPHQARHGAGLRILIQIETHQAIGVAEQVGGDGLGAMRLADPRRAEKQEGRQRPIRIIEAGLGNADDVRGGVQGSVLTDDLAGHALRNLFTIEPRLPVEERHRQTTADMEFVQRGQPCHLGAMMPDSQLPKQ